MEPLEEAWLRLVPYVLVALLIASAGAPRVSTARVADGGCGQPSRPLSPRAPSRITTALLPSDRSRRVAGAGAGNETVELMSAAGARGTGVVLWRATRLAGVATRSVLRAVRRRPGRAWSRPVSISTPGRNVSAAEVAMNRHGDAVAIWKESRARRGRIKLASRRSGRAWSPPRLVSGVGTDRLAVALGDGGALAVAWYDGERFQLVTRRRGRWARRRSGRVGFAARVALDVDPSGRVAAAWVAWPGPKVMATTGSRSRGWRRPRALVRMPGGVSVSAGPAAAVAGSGGAIAGWMTERRHGRMHGVAVAEARERGRWTTPQRLHRRDVLGSALALDANARGEAIVGWSGGDPFGAGGVQVRAARRDSDGRWHPAEPVSVAGLDAGAVHVAMARDGRGHALWSLVGSESGTLQSATRTRSGPWSQPTTLTSDKGLSGATELDGGALLSPVARSRALAVWVGDPSGAGCGRAASLPLPPAIGFGEQRPHVFANPYWQGLGLPHVRLVVAWDALRHRWQRQETDEWLAAARAAGARPLVAFRAARDPATRDEVPKVREYKRSFLRFRARYPHVTDYVAWNEANHFPGLRNRPRLAARYFDAMKGACPRCRIVAADVLDVATMSSWLRRFRAAARHRPRIWGLHNYIDANYFRTSGTERLLRTVKGEVWFTETGGLVHRRHSIPTEYAASPSHAARATRWVLDRLAFLSPRIRRVYLYHFVHQGPGTSWDSGLIDPDGRLRPAFDVVAEWVAWAERARARRQSSPPPATGGGGFASGPAASGPRSPRGGSGGGAGAGTGGDTSGVGGG